MKGTQITRILRYVWIVPCKILTSLVPKISHGSFLGFMVGFDGILGCFKMSADDAEGADWMLGEGNVDRFFCLIG
jgi:hypothetical protein